MNGRVPLPYFPCGGEIMYSRIFRVGVVILPSFFFSGAQVP